MVEHIRVTPDKCKACRRCEVACIAAHHNMSFKEAMKHRDTFVSRVQVVKAEGIKTTVRCHQCQNAPCCQICPTHALKQEEDGRISMHEEQCIACGMCISACPYGAISLDAMRAPKIAAEGEDGAGGEIAPQPDSVVFPHREVAVRCDMCHTWRLENGKKITACMEACPVRALSMVMPDGSVVEPPKPEKKAKEGVKNEA